MSGFSSMNDDYERIQDAWTSGGPDDSDIEAAESGSEDCECCEWCPDEVDTCNHERCNECEECVKACECERCTSCEELSVDCECEDCDCDVCSESDEDEEPSPKEEPANPSSLEVEASSSSGKFWSKEEVTLLKRMFEAGHNLAHMATQLNRTPMAALYKLYRLRLVDEIDLEPSLQKAQNRYGKAQLP